MCSVRENFTCEKFEKFYSSAAIRNTGCFEMGNLFKYFKRTDDKARSILPDPQESLSSIVPSSRIEAVNTMVKPVIEEQIDGNCSSRGKYEIFSPDEKAKIGKRAAEHGVLATIRHFSKICPDHVLQLGGGRTGIKMSF